MIYHAHARLALKPRSPLFYPVENLVEVLDRQNSGLRQIYDKSASSLQLGRQPGLWYKKVVNWSQTRTNLSKTWSKTWTATKFSTRIE